VVTPDRWQAIKELLDRALQTPANERAALLDRACANDPALRREVESLLGDDPTAPGFLEPPQRMIEVDMLERLRSALGAVYRIDREWARGGMSTVYLASDLKHRRKVAIKVLHDGAMSAFGVQRFRREIEVLAKLQHPNILPLIDSGVVDWALYYVMPFIEGESLRGRLLREKQLPIDDALRITCEVADALGYAHSCGIVHRDIKPENILLSGGHAIVADFGIGKVTAGSGNAPITSSGSVVGTPAYVSPEQGAGQRDVDGRSDLYSLGIVLYELLSGEPPFLGATPHSVIVKRFTEPITPLRRIRDTVPEYVESAAMKLLARAPADRYASAAELITALTSPPREARRSGPATHDDSGARATPSIVVLPFANMSANPDDEYFSDGMTEEIISALTRLRSIRVVARTSSFAFKGKAMDVREIAERLRVSNVLEGSVRRSGDRLRVSAELIDVVDGCRVWAEQFDRKVDDVFAVQDELARRIVESLQATLLGGLAAPAVSQAPTTRQAYEPYLKGRYNWHRRTEQSLRKGIAYFEEAIACDGRFAQAYAGLADSYTMLCIYGHMSPAEAMPKARSAALNALALDDTLAETHTTLGCIKAVYDWNWADAEREFRQALTMNPLHPSSHHRYALDCLAPRGRFDDASSELEQARALDPLSLVINTSTGLPPYFARRYEIAERAYRNALELDPTFGVAHFFLGRVQVEQGRIADAIASFGKAIELGGPTAQVSAALANAHVVLGERAQAQSILDALRRDSQTRYTSPCLLAQVHLGLGEIDQALAHLEDAYTGRAADLVWLNVNPSFDSLRSDPRFTGLLDRIGFAS